MAAVVDEGAGWVVFAGTIGTHDSLSQKINEVPSTVMKKHGKRIKKGDVFFIPGLEGQGCLAQVVSPGIVFYIKVYSPLFSETEATIDKLKPDMPIFLAGEVTDGEYRRGVWKFIGNVDVDDFSFPYHVVDNGECLVLRDFNNTVIRKASEDDFARFGYRNSCSSPVFTTAVRRRCKEGPDVEYFNIDARRVMSKSVISD